MRMSLRCAHCVCVCVCGAGVCDVRFAFLTPEEQPLYWNSPRNTKKKRNIDSGAENAEIQYV